MGEPGRGNARSSKYPEEKKENSISLVVASEEERGQTGGLRTTGVEGLRHLKIADPNPLESGTKESDSLVGEGDNR